MKTLWNNIKYLNRHDLRVINRAKYSLANDHLPETAFATQVEAGTSTLPQVLDMDVHEFFKTDRVDYLTNHAKSLMYRKRITTVRQLTNWTAKELSDEQGFGQKTIDYIRYMLAKHGLKLKGEL